MSIFRKINYIANNKTFKNGGLVFLGVLLTFTTLYILSSSIKSFFFTIHYVRGYGGYSVPIIGLILGVLFIYYGILGFFKNQNN